MAIHAHESYRAHGHTSSSTKQINSSSTVNVETKFNNVTNNHKSNSDINQNDSLRLSPIEATYTSLIQQYLSLLCFENASFLAERMVAHCRTKHSIYLLATCYHRMGQVKRAYSLLVGQGQHYPRRDKGYYGKKNRNNEKNYISNNTNVASRFLLAKCCLELGLLEEAEDCLLPRTRESLGRLGKTGSSDEALDPFSKWILTEPCPIPNGAAGLHLLGIICRKSHRKKQAAKYFSLSLKLDPMMWASFEALCDMGCTETNSKSDLIDIDPIKIFGVTPPALQSLPSHNEPFNMSDLRQDEYPYPGDDINCSTYETGNNDRINPSFDITSNTIRARENNELNITPPPPAAMDLSYNTPIHPSVKRTHSQNKLNVVSRKYSLPVASTLFGDKSDFDEIPKTEDISAIPNINSAGRNVTSNNSSTLFDTPNLTPIQYGHLPSSAYPRNQHDDSFTIDKYGIQTGDRTQVRRLDYDKISTVKQAASRYSASQTSNSAIANVAAMAPPKSTSFHLVNESNPMVMTQAKKVVARLYYEPSPEQYTPRSEYKQNLDLSYSMRKTSFQKNKYMNMNLTQSHFSFTDESESSVDLGKKIDLSLNQPNDNSITFGVNQSKRGLSTNVAESSGGILGGLGGSTTRKTHESHEKLDVEESRYNKRPGDENDVAMEGNMTPLNGDIEIDDDCIQQILSLLSTLGSSYKLLCQYKCKGAIHLFHTLPASQFHTGWVQHQIGKAFFEMADYNSAKRSLELMQSIEPHRMKGLELLSTALWHLKKEVDLCNLAQRVVDFDRLCPESWCVVGNCFSLQKEHETALQFFKRSIQLDPTFTYSHTLSGHEYVSNEDFDRATSCYRDAIRVDERHYNAWYGLGAIYFRQEKLDLAEYHFRRALTINPQSSVLLCHLGMTQFANNKPYEALDTLYGAFKIDPRNAQARYQRANIYMSLDQPREALDELEKVRDAAPREASVHFAMGKVCKRLGWPERAMRCFLTALDLEPKDNNLIKAAMEKLNDADIEEDVSAF